MPRLPEVRQFFSSAGARIYRIPCKVTPELTARVYLILEAGPPTLVDVGSGYSESTQNILDGFDTLRRDFDESIRIEDVKRIVITHGHLDHYGGLPELLTRTKAEICIHPLDARLITAHEEAFAVARLGIRRLLAQAGVPENVGRELLTHQWFLPCRLSELSVEVTLLEENKIDGLRIIHTPGHSPGHVCLMVDDLLLCGDHILPRTIPQLWPESLRPYKGLGHYLESLDVIRRVPNIRIALSGHEPIIEDVYRRIDDIERSEHRRTGYVLDILAEAKGSMTIWEVARSIYQQTTGFYAALAFMDTAARVEWLHQRGRLRLANYDQVESDSKAAWQYHHIA